MHNLKSQRDDEDVRHAKGLALVFFGLVLLVFIVPVIGNYVDKVSKENKDMERLSEQAKIEHDYRKAAFPPVGVSAKLIHSEFNKARANAKVWKKNDSFDRSQPIHENYSDCNRTFEYESGWLVTVPGQKKPILLAVKGANTNSRSTFAKADPLLNEPVTELHAFSIQDKGGLDTLQHWNVELEVRNLSSVQNTPAKLVLHDALGQVVKTWQIKCRYTWQVQGNAGDTYFDGPPDSGIKAKQIFGPSSLFR